MATTVFNNGLDQLQDWTTDTFGFLLVDNVYVVDPDDVYVAAAAADELSGVGYARYAVATPTRTVDNALDRITYDCEDPDFGTIAIGETADAMILYRLVTNDADSPMIAYYPLGGVATTGLSFIVAIALAGIAYTEQG